MGQTISTIEPTQIGQGVTTKWTRDLASFPVSEGWHLSYRLAGPRPTTLNAAASNGTHLVTITSASAAVLPAGKYWWQSTAASPAIGESYRVSTGKLEVLPDLSLVTDSGYDGRSPFAVILDAIDAMLKNVASKAQQSFSVDGRSLSEHPRESLLRMRDYYAEKVAAEDAQEALANGGANPNKIRVRFTRA